MARGSHRFFVFLLLLFVSLPLATRAGAWTYDRPGRSMTDGNWVLEASPSGETGIAVTKILSAVDDRSIDLAGPVQDEGGARYQVTEIGPSVFSGRETLRQVVLPASLRTIGKQAFYHCTGLASVDPFLPAEVVRLGESAFDGCEALTGDLVLSNPGLTSLPILLFRGCGQITSVDLSGSRVVDAQSDGYGNGHTFYQCGSLTNVVLPETLRKVSISMFQDCGKLVHVQPFLPRDLSYIGKYAFQSCTNLTGDLVLSGEKLTALPVQPFYGCRKITSVDMSGSRIGEVATDGYQKGHTFCQCGSLTNVVLPETLRKVSNSMFQGCGRLVRVRPFLPRDLKYVGPNAFEGCTNLTGDLVLSGAELTALPIRPFYECRKITSVDMSGSRIADVRTDGYGKGHAFYRCGSLTNAVLPETLRKISNSMFRECGRLARVQPFLPRNLNFIGHNAFEGCTNLTGDLVLSGEGLTTLPVKPFYECRKITSIDMSGSGITMVKDDGYGWGHAFYRCCSLTNVVLPEKIEVLGSSMFAGCENLVAVSPFLPPSLRQIRAQAFARCGKLAGELSISAKELKYLPIGAFQGCTSLTGADLGNSGIIGLSFDNSGYNDGFDGCTSLTNVVFPIGLGGVFGGRVLDNCTALESLFFKGDVPTVRSSFLRNIDAYRVRIYVPRRNESWQSYGENHFVPLTPAEEASYEEAYPGDPFPVGTWKTPGDPVRKQWVLTWTIPEILRERTILLVR